MARRPSQEPDFDRELADLPPELRWREWKARVEAVLFAAAKPVNRETCSPAWSGATAPSTSCSTTCARICGGGRSSSSGGGVLHPPHPAGVRAGDPRRLRYPGGREAADQTRGGRADGDRDVPADDARRAHGDVRAEISRDLIAALREEGLIAAGPRSPKLGAPYAYVTTEKFLLEFGFELLRDLPDLASLEDAGLLGAASRDEPGRAGLGDGAAGEPFADEASGLADRGSWR